MLAKMRGGLLPLHLVDVSLLIREAQPMDTDIGRNREPNP